MCVNRSELTLQIHNKFFALPRCSKMRQRELQRYCSSNNTHNSMHHLGIILSFLHSLYQTPDPMSLLIPHKSSIKRKPLPSRDESCPVSPLQHLLPSLCLGGFPSTGPDLQGKKIMANHTVIIILLIRTTISLLRIFSSQAMPVLQKILFMLHGKHWGAAPQHCDVQTR